MTTTVGQELVPHQPPSIPALRAADQGVASSLESVLSDNTRRVYGTQWRIFAGWCDEVGLTSLPAEPLTVARYLAARANSGASIATITPGPRPRPRNARAGRPARPLRPGPGGRVVGRRAKAFRGGGADLGRRAALG